MAKKPAPAPVTEPTAAPAPAVESAPAPSPNAKAAPATTKARVLVSGTFGTINDVVELAPELLRQGVDSGQVDPNPEAVAYAASLKG